MRDAPRVRLASDTRACIPGPDKGWKDCLLGRALLRRIGTDLANCGTSPLRVKSEHHALVLGMSAFLWGAVL
jgi:hypothetical protein